MQIFMKLNVSFKKKWIRVATLSQNFIGYGIGNKSRMQQKQIRVGTPMQFSLNLTWTSMKNSIRVATLLQNSPDMEFNF